MLYDLLTGRTVWVNPLALPSDDWEDFLEFVPMRNRAAKEVKESEDKLLVVMPPDAGGFRRTAKHKVLSVTRGGAVTYILEGSSREVYLLCSGKRSIREIIEKYNKDRNLSFHTVRIAVSQMVKSLSQRGMVVLITD